MPIPKAKPTRESVTRHNHAKLAKILGRHPVKGAQGLCLKVISPTLRYWTYRYVLNGRESELSLGAYPDMALAEAIAAHALRRSDVLNGVDPQGARRKRRAPSLRSGSPMTFGEAADALFEKRNGDWTNLKHAKQWKATLGLPPKGEGDGAPAKKRRPGVRLPAWFLARPINAIEPETILEVLGPIWKTKTTTARRLRCRIEAVLESTRGSKDDHRNPAAMTDWLRTQLGKPRDYSDPSTGGRPHHRALPFRRVPALMAELEARRTPGARGLMLLILTGARDGEIRGMQWAEIDTAYEIGDSGVTEPMWVIPPGRMKARRRHRVPLSGPAIGILERQRAETNSEGAVFPGLAQQAFFEELKRIAIGGTAAHLLTTTHGLRTAFRSWCSSVGAPPEIAEDALAHSFGSQVTQSYARPDSPELRIELMSRWADFCMGAIDEPQERKLLAASA
jgi:integrase